MGYDLKTQFFWFLIEKRREDPFENSTPNVVPMRFEPIKTTILFRRRACRYSSVAATNEQQKRKIVYVVNICASSYFSVFLFVHRSPYCCRLFVLAADEVVVVFFSICQMNKIWLCQINTLKIIYIIMCEFVKRFAFNSFYGVIWTVEN